MNLEEQIVHTENLLNNLDKEDLHALVSTWDCGHLDQFISDKLVVRDAKNYPGEYVQFEDDDALAAHHGLTGE